MNNPTLLGGEREEMKEKRVYRERENLHIYVCVRVREELKEKECLERKRESFYMCVRVRERERVIERER